MSNLLPPNYVASFHRMLKISPYTFFSCIVYLLLSRWGDGDSYAANSKNMLILFSRYSLFSLWACLCNPDEQPATKLCGTSLQSLKNKQSLLSLWACLCNPDEQPATKLFGAISQTAKKYTGNDSFQAESTVKRQTLKIWNFISRWSLLSLWDCLCNLDEWPTAKLCTAKK